MAKHEPSNCEVPEFQAPPASYRTSWSVRVKDRPYWTDVSGELQPFGLGVHATRGSIGEFPREHLHPREVSNRFLAERTMFLAGAVAHASRVANSATLHPAIPQGRQAWKETAHCRLLLTTGTVNEVCSVLQHHPHPSIHPRVPSRQVIGAWLNVSLDNPAPSLFDGRTSACTPDGRRHQPVTLGRCFS